MHSLSSLRFPAAAMAVAVAFLSSSALAQDGSLQIRVLKNVLMPGQSTDVQVFARFTPSAYAFASAQFCVLADIPAWSYASAGAIAGSDVVNIDIGQVHQPWLGNFADPANPLRIWRGTFQPTSWVPQLVQIETSPLGISIYPSKLTSSSAPCTPHPDRDWIAVNPLPVWRTGVVPGEGTSIARTSANAIRAQAPTGAILMGLLLPAVQKEAERTLTTITPAQPLDRLIVTVVPQRNGGDDAPTEEVNFAFAPAPMSPTSGLRVTFSEAIGYEFHAFRGGVRVSVFICPTGDLPFALAAVPVQFTSRVERDAQAQRSRVVCIVRFDRPQVVSVPNGPSFSCDVLEAHAVQHNLKQILVGMHRVETHGAGIVQCAFSDGSVR